VAVGLPDAVVRAGDLGPAVAVAEVLLGDAPEAVSLVNGVLGRWVGAGVGGPGRGVGRELQVPARL
jgi:hypothetical protein